MFPYQATGSFILDENKMTRGSHLQAQHLTDDKYFHIRIQHKIHNKCDVAYTTQS